MGIASRRLVGCFRQWAFLALLFFASVPTASAQGDADAAREADRNDADRERREKLSDRIKSVQRKVFIKKNRVELFPSFGLNLNDAFFRSYLVDGSLAYHLSDAFSIEARGGGVVGRSESSVIRFVRRETDSLLQDPPELSWHGELDVLVSPFYGKISIFGEGILHFDTYVALGGGVFATDDTTAGAANIGIGQRFFLTEWLTARIEFRNYFFVDEQAGENELQTPGFLTFSLSGFLPTSFSHQFE
jgi:outer membrane beta-barrel protein